MVSAIELLGRKKNKFDSGAKSRYSVKRGIDRKKIDDGIAFSRRLRRIFAD
jgi:hypothetical protein